MVRPVTLFAVAAVASVSCGLVTGNPLATIEDLESAAAREVASIPKGASFSSSSSSYDTSHVLGAIALAAQDASAPGHAVAKEAMSTSSSSSPSATPPMGSSALGMGDLDEESAAAEIAAAGRGEPVHAGMTLVDNGAGADPGDVKTAIKDTEKKEVKDPNADGKGVNKAKLEEAARCVGGVRTSADFAKCAKDCDDRVYGKKAEKDYLGCYACCQKQLNRHILERCPRPRKRPTDPPCSGRGSCLDGKCQCDHLWEGRACDVVRSPRAGRIGYKRSPRHALAVFGTSVLLGDTKVRSDGATEWKFGSDGRVHLARDDSWCLDVPDATHAAQLKNGLSLGIVRCTKSRDATQKFLLRSRTDQRLVLAGASGRGFAVTVSGDGAEDKGRVELEEVHEDTHGRAQFIFSGRGVHFSKCSKRCTWDEAAKDSTVYLSCFMDTCADTTSARRWTNRPSHPFFDVPASTTAVEDAGGVWEAQHYNGAKYPPQIFERSGVTKTLTHGIGMHGDGDVTFDLDALREYGIAMTRFVAEVAAPSRRPCSNAQATAVYVLVDNKEAWKATLKGDGSRHSVSVDLPTGAKKLNLRTRFVGRHCNYVLWGSAGVTTVELGHDGLAVVAGASDPPNHWTGRRYAYGPNKKGSLYSVSLPLDKNQAVYSAIGCEVYDNGWLGTSLTVERVPDSASLTPIVEGSRAYNRHTGWYMPAFTQGAWRSQGKTQAELHGVQQCHRPGHYSTYMHCSQAAFVVRSGNVVGKSTDPRKPWAARVATVRNKSYYANDMKTSITVTKGKYVYASVSCNLNNYGGGTIYMRISHKATKGTVKDVVRSNWMTITQSYSQGSNAFMNGVTQAAYYAATDATLELVPTYHVGSHQGVYQDCNIIAFEADGEITGADSLANYSKTWSSRRIWHSWGWRRTDFSTKVNAKAGDIFYVKLASNAYNWASHRARMAVAVKKSARPVRYITPPNYTSAYSHAGWASGASHMMIQATGDGVIELDGMFQSSYHYATYVYSNIVAIKIGRGEL